MSAHKQGALRPPVSDKDHSLGPTDARVTLVEYGDYQCPHCFRAHPVIKAVLKQLGSQVRFVFRNFPITEMHPEALHAAEAAESVATRVGAAAFWKMHDAIYEHQQDSEDALDDAHLLRYAKSSGADPDGVALDLEEDRFEERVRSDFMSGVRSGVNGTPTFFVQGERFDGDWTDPEVLLRALQE
jgi:protein-disulfide isomerase